MCFQAGWRKVCVDLNYQLSGSRWVKKYWRKTRNLNYNLVARHTELRSFYRLYFILHFTKQDKVCVGKISISISISMILNIYIDILAWLGISHDSRTSLYWYFLNKHALEFQYANSNVHKLSAETSQTKVGVVIGLALVN